MNTNELIKGTPIDWDSIIAESQRVKENSWSPESGFKVGAAALLEDGRIVSGTNVENGSYGVTLCAECSMTSENVSGGRSLFVAISVVGPDGLPLIPCGRCRTVMADHSSRSTLLMTPEGPKFLLGEIFPYPFHY